MAHDIFYDVVRTALTKDGWVITHDPYLVSVGGIDVQIDLGVEKLLAAEKGMQRIAVEIKSFVKSSAISEFHMALGQYLNYQQALDSVDPERQLYLAIPRDTYTTFFQLPFLQHSITRHRLALLIYHPQQEVITQWIP